ncbi:MAG: prephenate dehydrogenase/arogenate dehydrogenase family protein [Chthoniobacteraceae bacterium]
MSHSIAIIGPGLLGASIALAARRAGGMRVAIWARRPQMVEEVRARGIADVISSDLGAVLAEAQTVVLCVPVGAMPALAREIVTHISPGALITDVGSVKAGVVAELGPIFSARGRFIGSHPMAGSDKAGHTFASAELFDGRVCIVTPDAATRPDALADATAFWQMLGCTVRTLVPAEHDEVVALVSHLPHLLAATLVNTVAAQNPAAFDFHGPGFFDTTRVAAGQPELWAEILRTNSAAVRAGAEAMIEKLREITTLLEREAPMKEFLTQAKTLRDALRPTNTDV